MYRHVSTFHLDLGQLWRCTVSWCTVWKGTPQDCMDHVRGAHDVPSDIKSASLDKLFPPCTSVLSGVRFGQMTSSLVIRECRRMSYSSVRYISHWCITTGCSEGGCLITPFAWTTSADYGSTYRRRRGLMSPVPRNVRPCDTETESPRKTRRVRRRMRPTRLRDDPVHVPSLMTADQAVLDLTGAVIYDCRPRILPVLIKLRDCRRPSGVRPAASASLAPPEFTVISSDDPGTDLEDELLQISLLPPIVSPLPESDAAPGVSLSLYPAPPVPTLADPELTSCLPSVPLRVVNELPAIDLFPSYTMSSEHSYYDQETSPVTSDVPDDPGYLSPGSPAAMDRCLAEDGDLMLDCPSDLPLLPTVRQTFPCYPCFCCRFRPTVFRPRSLLQFTLRMASFRRLWLCRLMGLERAPSMPVIAFQRRGLLDSAWTMCRGHCAGCQYGMTSYDATDT